MILSFNWFFKKCTVTVVNDTWIIHLKLAKRIDLKHFQNNNLSSSSSVTQSCSTLWDPMKRSMQGLPVHHKLPESTQLMSIESVMPSGNLILCSPLLLLPQSLPASGSFPMSQHVARGGQSIGVSALASVPPMNTHDWSPLGWTGWIFLQSKWLSRVFSNTTV